MNNSKVLAAVIGGLAAGIGLGILFAPEKGSRTRNKLVQPFKSREEELKARAARRTNNVKRVKTKAAGFRPKLSATNVKQAPVRSAVRKTSGPSDNTSNPSDNN